LKVVDDEIINIRFNLHSYLICDHNVLALDLANQTIDFSLIYYYYILIDLLNTKIKEELNFSAFFTFIFLCGSLIFTSKSNL
jgi:hypothetical protein